MFALLAFVLFVIAGILKLVDKHLDWIVWLIIVGGILVSAEVVWGWHRAGGFRRNS